MLEIILKYFLELERGRELQDLGTTRGLGITGYQTPHLCSWNSLHSPPLPQGPWDLVSACLWDSIPLPPSHHPLHPSCPAFPLVTQTHQTHILLTCFALAVPLPQTLPADLQAAAIFLITPVSPETSPSQRCPLATLLYRCPLHLLSTLSHFTHFIFFTILNYLAAVCLLI